ncbi:serine/arginine repetitive matrix protein 1-like [Brachypodium distachyon]|uniref:serine/arginine repetitive matrix protein 1-like n=1 Tax=Brachypodium distachyon TaxID=15368 RepID=UPI00052FE03A|nr:serine/arginine repetitive matrix protein 1-like [Brachypodium distachyon]|eukprot:XP_010236355.1 serine/arginine repetitive matrix protein 1-like [Brachypodium distachyon]
MSRRGRHPKPEHHDARKEPSRRRHRHGPTRRRRTPSPPPRQRREECDDRRRPTLDAKAHEFVGSAASAEMSRPRLRSEIGEVRGSLERISVAEYMAREAAATATPSPSRAPATHDTEAPFSVRRDDSAVHGFAGTGNSFSSLPNPPVRRTSNQPLFTAAPGLPPYPNADDSTPASKRRKTTIPTTVLLEPPPMSTNAPATFKPPSQQTVPERRQHTNAFGILEALQHVPEPEPDVLARAASLRTQFAGIISKANETLSANRQQKLKKKLQPKPAAAAADDNNAIASGGKGVADEEEDEEAEMCREALRKVEERKAQVASQRKTAREELLEVERKARLNMDEEALPPGVPMDGRQCSPVEVMLGLFVKPMDDSGDEDI